MTNSETGRQIGLYDHIRQSIKNILFTRIGTRLMREEYGSLLPELLDQPITPALLLQCQAAAIAALAKWEPRIEIQAATVSAAAASTDAKVIINIEAVNISTGTLETYSIRK